MKIIFNFILLFLTFTNFSNAKDFDYPTKTKKIVKEFVVGQNITMNVTNLYGNITVLLWDQDKINYSVEITVGTNSEKKTKELLDEINIEFSQKSNQAFATTVLPNFIINNKQMEINYTIKIPRNAMVNVDQKYGNIIINELNNNLNLASSYGNITLGDIKSKHNNLKLSYNSSSTINFINYAFFDIRYSTIKIGTLNYLVSKGNYNDFEINNAGTFNFDTNYSKIKSGKVLKSEISGNYLTIDLGTVSVSSIVKSNYTNVKKAINSETEFVQILGNYTTANLNNLESFPFSFSIKGSYLNFNNDLYLQYTLHNKTANKKEFIGFNKKTANLKINFEGNYATLNFKK